MKFKYPKYYYNLDDKKQQEWEDFVGVFQTIDSRFQVIPSPKPAITNFYLFASKRKPIYYKSWTVFDNALHFKLLMIEYEIEWIEAATYGAFRKTDTHKYFFGYVTSKRNFGRVIMRPESIGDKISGLFHHIEIDIKGFNKFNRKYYLLANDKAKFLGTIDRETLNFLATTRGLQLEIDGQRCLFRLQKALDRNETMELCRIGHKLNVLLSDA